MDVPHSGQSLLFIISQLNTMYSKFIFLSTVYLITSIYTSRMVTGSIFQKNSPPAVFE